MMITVLPGTNPRLSKNEHVSDLPAIFFTVQILPKSAIVKGITSLPFPFMPNDIGSDAFPF